MELFESQTFSGRTINSIGSERKSSIILVSCPLKREPIFSTETSVRNYGYFCVMDQKSAVLIQYLI
jgi:hypothetical protein